MDKENRNLISNFNKGWTLRNAENDSVTDVIATDALPSENKAILTLSKDKPVLQKYEFTADISDKGAYRFCVEYSVSGARSQLAAYGLITLLDSAGNGKRRLYMKRNGKYLELTFVSEEECQARIELGMKQAGSVIWSNPVLNQCEMPKARNVKIASVHMDVIRSSTYENNLKRIENGVCEAAANGADVVLFPETIADRATEMPEDKVFEPISGTLCSFMKELAEKNKCYIIFTYHETDENGLKHNTAILIDRQGEIAGRYVKTHQALVEYERGMVPGDLYPVFDTDFGRIGILICWDAYFAEPAHELSMQGAEILFVSTAGNPTYRHIARAKENGVYVAVACAGQQDDSGIHPTKIISPSGRILSHTDEDGGLAFAEIDLNKNDYIYWLSVGDANTNPREVYSNEYRDDII